MWPLYDEQPNPAWHGSPCSLRPVPGYGVPSAPRCWSTDIRRLRTGQPDDVTTSAPLSHTTDDSDGLDIRCTKPADWFAGAAMLAAIIVIWMLLELWSGQ